MELMRKFAFNEGVIKRKEDLKKRINIKSIPMEEGLKYNNKFKYWWANGFIGEFKEKESSNWTEVYIENKIINQIYDYKNLLKLKEILMSFGGDDVCLNSYEEDLENILSRGQLWINKRGRITEIKGEPNQCHRNSCNLYEQNKDNFEIHLCTGYALCHRDSIWRQHSWVVYIDKNTGKSKIIETTVKWSAYFGYVMTTEESEKFAQDNY